MTLDQKKLIEGIHLGLLELLASDGFDTRATDDTRALAVRLEAMTRGPSLPGQHDAELARRAGLLVSIADPGIKGRAARVTKTLQCYERSLRAARTAIEGAEE